MSILKYLFRPATHTLKEAMLPQHCVLCGVLSDKVALCKECNADLPHLSPLHCPRCALPTSDGSFCGACITAPPAFDSTYAAFAYAFPIDNLIQSFKYQKNFAIVQILTPALYDVIDKGQLPEIIIPMPLSAERLRERGFNQALEIARILGKALNVPVKPYACERVRDTVSQAALPWKERVKNIRGAFIADSSLNGKNVAIVDDVLTSGATLHELAKTIRKGGAKNIQAWVVARAIPR